MGKRFLVPLVLGGFIAILLILYRGGPNWLPVLHEGDASPAVWRTSDPAEVLVGWVFKAEDCLSCYTPASALRHLQGEYGSRVRIAAVLVGRDSATANSFLRRERLNVQLTSLSTLGYRKQFRWTPTPALYVVRDGEIALLAPNASGVAFEDTVRRFLAD
jgi:hypothetical protein